MSASKYVTEQQKAISLGFKVEMTFELIQDNQIDATNHRYE